MIEPKSSDSSPQLKTAGFSRVILDKQMKDGALIDGILCTALYFRDLFYQNEHLKNY